MAGVSAAEVRMRKWRRRWRKRCVSDALRCERCVASAGGVSDEEAAEAVAEEKTGRRTKEAAVRAEKEASTS